MRDSHQTKIHFKVPCPCLSALSLPSIQGCIPTQALIIREVSISNPTDPWLASRHQPMGWLHLPTTKHTVKWFYAPQRWVGNLFSGCFFFFFHLWNICVGISGHSPGKSTSLQVNPKSVWPVTVQLWMALPSPSLQSWSILPARRRMPMGTWSGMSTVRMVRSWRRQVLPRKPGRARPWTCTHIASHHHKASWGHIDWSATTL